jgi:3-isopropylmalate/(R)-2-methylmalate dehydratase small subunit
MEPFTEVKGIVAPMDRPNVDTDQIVPARYLKRIERTGWGEVLFYDWRNKADGTPNPEFVLNQPEYKQASVLVAGRNFGSGSSREHAVWAIVQYGMRAVIVSSLADIFHKNCFENGLVPVLVPDQVVEEITARAKANPGYRVTVNLDRCEVWDDEGLRAPFVVHADRETHEFRRHCLLNGLDEIALTLQDEDDIDVFESRRAEWLSPAAE